MTQGAQQEETSHTTLCEDREAGELRDSAAQDNARELALSEFVRLRETVLAELERRKKL
jgi:hypothetical protein